MTDDVWARMRAELDAWAEADRTARFWLRDDDAVDPTAALDRLLALCRRHGIALTLAVIPEHTGEGLARHLDAWPLANVAVHGWSHANHAGAGEKKQELGLHRGEAAVLDELRAGFEKLTMLHAGRFTPTLVPPWNRIAAVLILQLGALGFETLSVFGPEKPGDLPLVNTHADIMDWHGTRGARPCEDIVADVVKRLVQMRDGGGAMGLLTHHLVHDEAAWLFLDQFVAETKAHPACRWMSLPDILAEDSSGSRE